jgi:hypothetical protein
MDKQKVYCHWDLIRFISEEALEKYCVSVEDVMGKSHFELMIYLYKDGKKYTIQIHKSEKEKDFDLYTFDSLDDLKDFFESLFYKHPEYKERPYVKIEIQKETK